jgi:hypothetical protein
MARHVDDEDDWEDDADEEIDDDFDDEDKDEPTTPCPYCKRPIHEDAQRCPYCEQYISEEDAPSSRRPWWILIGIALCFYAIYRWIFG